MLPYTAKGLKTVSKLLNGFPGEIKTLVGVTTPHLAQGCSDQFGAIQHKVQERGRQSIQSTLNDPVEGLTPLLGVCVLAHRTLHNAPESDPFRVSGRRTASAMRCAVRLASAEPQP